MVFVAIALGIFFYVVPRYVDANHNKLTTTAPAVAQAGGLHRRLIVADLHADCLPWDRDLVKENDWGHVDIPRLILETAVEGAQSVRNPRG